MTYDFFNQPYQVTVPKPVQMIILSMILQNLIIASKDGLLQVKNGLTTAYYDRGKQKILYEIVDDAKDVKTFNDNVLRNKDHLMALAKGT
jgi:hypothetical protein